MGQTPRALSGTRAPGGLFLDDACLGLATDLYELTMAAAYFESGAKRTATFELFIRDMPAGRSFLLAAGLEQAVHYLENLHFSASQIAWLRRLPTFAKVHPGFFDFLADLRFSGDLWAMPEGTVFFPEEPLLRIQAPIVEAQVVETYLLSVVNFQVSVASKAARLVLAAQGREVVEFGTRRAHGPQAGVLAARAGYLGGCHGTSNVLAGQQAGIPVYGTMAHSYVLSFNREIEAFRRYQRSFPETCILLVDTYDTLRAVRRAIEAGLEFQGIRLDSGDLLLLSRQCRRMLDESGRGRVRILASGDLNEHRIAELVGQQAPIDAFGVGTELATCRDEPALGGVYKLVNLQTGSRSQPRVKLSSGKLSFPGVKQVYRKRDARQRFLSDWICLHLEKGPPGAEALLLPVLRKGRRVAPVPGLEAARQRARQQLEQLPEQVKRLQDGKPYPVRASPRLRELRNQLLRRKAP